MLVQDQKPSLDDLMHYGVLGMKWGQRRKATGGQIREARRRLDAKRSEYRRADDKAAAARPGSREARVANAKVKRLEKEFKDDPDRAIAIRMTRGEKVASVLLLGPIGLLPIVGTSATSRIIENQQDSRKKKK